MTGSLATRNRKAYRRRLCVARGLTVMGIGVAAIASCQRFRPDTDPMYADLDARLSDIDACDAQDGRWNLERDTCEAGEATPAD
ncbi:MULTISPECIES: hypothetical protein [unclassified Luteibacter]|uniref:hypothetical protein n=1 Tax=Luteibacter sp. PvP019 TaxID=3156436 RepID=UPI003394C405